MALTLSKMSTADLKKLRYEVGKKLPTKYQFRRLAQINREMALKENAP
jgi:hypothetical protein